MWGRSSQPCSCTVTATTLLHHHCSWPCLNCGYICNWYLGDSWYLYFSHWAAGSSPLSLDSNISVVMQLDHCRSYGRSSNYGLVLRQFSRSVVSDSLQLHGLKHTRIPCPSPTPKTWSNISIESVMLCNHLILDRPLSPPAFKFPQHQGLFQWVSFLKQVPKYWCFNFSISHSKEYSGLISFWIDWLDLLAVQGNLKNLLQHHSSKASILWCSTLFIVQLSHPPMTTGKTIALIDGHLLSK